MRTIQLVLILLVALAATPASGLDEARREMRLDKALAKHDVSGRGVLVAIIDRGLDYEHPTFRTANGTTRLEAIFDLTDDGGANDTANLYEMGTIYERGQIDSALLGGRKLPPQDREGRGTASAGIACGNGRGSKASKYRGIAPEATLLFVQIKLDPAVEELPQLDQEQDQAQDAEATDEVTFFELRRLRVAVEFCVARAKALKMPCVVLMNFGQPGGPTDGQSKLCRTLDETFGPGIEGLVFVTGPGDNGGRKNRARGLVAQGASVKLPVVKEAEGEVIVEIWYPYEDRFDVGIQTPKRKFGPYKAPKTGMSEYEDEFQYYHIASNKNLNRSRGGKRQIRVDLIGPPGKYVITLRGAVVRSGRFDAFIGPNPENPMQDPYDRFEAYVTKGSLWDGATAKHAICPGCYVWRDSWRSIRGQGFGQMGEGKRGDIWIGSGTGPTADGRHGITLCAPGDRIIAPYARGSDWATCSSYVISDDGGLYGLSSGTTASAALTTGLIALMLELNPKLDAAQVKTILQETAIRDAFTGAVPNATWGHGKLDAQAALARAVVREEKRKKKKRRR